MESNCIFPTRMMYNNENTSHGTMSLSMEKRERVDRNKEEHL